MKGLRIGRSDSFLHLVSKERWNDHVDVNQSFISLMLNQGGPRMVKELLELSDAYDVEDLKPMAATHVVPAKPASPANPTPPAP